MTQGMIERRAFSLEEEAQRLGVSIFTLRRRANEGLIRTIFIGARRLIPAEEAARLESHGIPRRARPRAAK